jgi:hypothetical protein
MVFLFNAQWSVNVMVMVPRSKKSDGFVGGWWAGRSAGGCGRKMFAKMENSSL